MTFISTHAAPRVSSRPAVSAIRFGKADTLIQIDTVPVLIGTKSQYKAGTQWPAQELWTAARESLAEYQDVLQNGWARVCAGNPKAEESQAAIRTWETVRRAAESLTQRNHAAASYLRHMVSSPDDTLNPEIVLGEMAMEDGLSAKNLHAGKFYAEGAEGVPADQEMALRFFNQAMTGSDPDDDQVGYSKLKVADVLIRGYHSVEKNPRQALAILDELIQSTPLSSEEGPFFQAEAARMKLRHLSGLLTASEKRDTIAVLKKAVTAEKATAYLVASTARFFATVLKDPKQAKALAVLASQKFYGWNQKVDAEGPVGSSKGIHGATEIMALAKDFATGGEGLPQDKALAKSLLETFLAELKTIYPVYEMEAARILAQQLDSPERAVDCVNIVLNSKFSPSLSLEAAQLLAKELKQPQRANEILEQISALDLAAANAKQKEPLTQANYVQMARIYAESLNQPELAEWRLSMALTYEFTGTHHQVENMIEIARIYKTLGKPDMSEWALDIVARSLQDDLQQKSRLAMAEAYESILGKTSAALFCLDLVVQRAPQYFNAPHCLSSVLGVFDTLDPKYPGLSERRQKVKAALDEALRTHPLFYSSEE